MKRKEEKEIIAAYHVFCNMSINVGKVDFYVSLKSLKNNERICAHCPLRGRCELRFKNKKRLHFYSTVQRNPKVNLPISVVMG